MCLYPSGRRESLERRCICTANLFFLIFLFHYVLHFLLKELLCDAWRSVYRLMITYAEVCQQVASLIMNQIVGSRIHVEPYTQALDLLRDDAANPTVHAEMSERFEKLKFRKPKFGEFTEIVSTIKKLGENVQVAWYSDPGRCSEYRETINELKGKLMDPLDGILKTESTAASLSSSLDSTLWFFSTCFFFTIVHCVDLQLKSSVNFI